jgi:hypothetical protein
MEENKSNLLDVGVNVNIGALTWVYLGLALIISLSAVAVLRKYVIKN